jgi:ATP-dependent Clp protease ATP-binding subunit ClpA
MKELQSVLNIVSDGLKTLAKGVEAIAEKVDEASKSQGVVKPKKKKPSKSAKKVTTAKKSAKKKSVEPATDTDKVLVIIGRSKKGASTATIMAKTGFDQKKIANIIYRLRKQKKIKSVDKGVYTKL